MSKLTLKTYIGERMEVLGEVVKYNSQAPKKLDLVVVAGSGPCLMGRDHIILDWKNFHSLSGKPKAGLESLLDKYEGVFGR